MHTITATFEDGVLKPTEPLDLPAHSKVKITIEAIQQRPLTVGSLNVFLQSLPPLGEDADQFLRDIQSYRTGFPAETSQWD
jgi:predicted DNA-binding antitoxin AbrB/MazE fold protein